MSDRIKGKKNFTEGPLFFKITLFSLPIMLTGVLQILYNMADNIVVGKFSGDDNALAAVGCTAALTNLIVNLLLGIASGAGVVISQTYGAKDERRVSRAVHTAMAFSMLGGIVFMIIGLFAAKPALILLDTDDAILESAALYMRIICIGIPASSVYNFGASILRSTGDSKTPLYILGASGMVNVILNMFFVIVCNMTVDGVAFATIISQYLSAFLVVFVLFLRKGESYALCIKKLIFDRRELILILKYGIPTGIQSSLFSISNVLLTGAVNTFPVTTVSAKTIAGNIDSITYTVMNCYLHSAMTFTGQNFGAGNYARVKKVLWYSLIQVVAVGILVSFVQMIFAPEIAWLFVDKNNPDAVLIIDTAVYIMKIFFYTYFLCGIQEVISGFARGMGYSLSPMLISLCGICLFRIFWISVIFPREAMNNLLGLYIVYPITWVITILMQTVLIIVALKRLNKLNSLNSFKELNDKKQPSAE